MQFKRIVVLAGEWDTTPIVYNFLQSNFGIEKIIIEAPVPRMIFVKKRIKNLGWLKVGGQILFQVLIGKILVKTSRRRIKKIIDTTKEIWASFPKQGGLLTWQRKVRYNMRNCPLYFYSKKSLVDILDKSGLQGKYTIKDLGRDFFVKASINK